jgi:hypothetical protein
MMAELETAEPATPELTKAEQKKKDEELTPAELLAFGILPPEPENLKLVKSPELENPDDALASSASRKDSSKPREGNLTSQD